MHTHTHTQLVYNVLTTALFLISFKIFILNTISQRETFSFILSNITNANNMDPQLVHL